LQFKVRSTLFFVPHELLGVPLFGVGWALGFLLISGIIWLAVQRKTGQSWSSIASGSWFWLMAGVLVTIVLPAVEQRWPDGTPIGLPVRGYGAMVLLGLLSGITVTNLRARQLGINSDAIVGLGIWAMLGGVAGARLFYVVQKWDSFSSHGIQLMIDIVKLTEGGLVIYGGIVGGLLTGGVYCLRHRLNVLSTGDLIVPGFLIGYSFGRLGCLLHGCCYGGVCASNLPSIQFPQGSIPYIAQIERGQILGLEYNATRLPAVIQSVQSGSLADKAGIQTGDQLKGILPQAMPPEDNNHPTASVPIAVEVTLNNGRKWFPADALPPRSLPVHPSQIYASLNALLLCLLMWHLQPLVNRDGMVLVSGMLLYAISRFLLEWIRTDEKGQFGTQLTIAQWIALATGLAALAGMVVLFRKPPQRLWKWREV